ncbi:MAG: hypothetical protein QOG99_2365 [Frankiales bacterium]|nr:hypothetical protein [Frankiales bacterium]
MQIEVLRWRELCAVAGTPAKARTLLKDGVYRRVVHDAYVLADVPDDATTRCAALRSVLPDDVLLSGWSALWASGLNVLPRDPNKVDLLDITIGRGRHLEPRPGIRSHSAWVPDEELCEINGLLVVSAARAFVDVARAEGVIEGVACGDAALRAGLTTVGRIQESVDRAGGLRWVVRAREAVPHLDARSESLMESRLRVDLVLTGGPRMQAQVDLYDDGMVHRGRADLYLRGVVFEYDGRESRLERAKFTGDRSRGNDIADLEVEVRRFTGALFYKTTPYERLGILYRALEIAAQRLRPRLRFGPDTLRSPRGRPLPTRAERKDKAA